MLESKEHKKERGVHCFILFYYYYFFHITYLSNRPHFLWVYRRDNPRGMLGEHEKSVYYLSYFINIHVTYSNPGAQVTAQNKVFCAVLQTDLKCPSPKILYFLI